MHVARACERLIRFIVFMLTLGPMSVPVIGLTVLDPTTLLMIWARFENSSNLLLLLSFGNRLNCFSTCSFLTASNVGFGLLLCFQFLGLISVGFDLLFLELLGLLLVDLGFAFFFSNFLASSLSALAFLSPSSSLFFVVATWTGLLAPTALVWVACWVWWCRPRRL